MKHIQFRFKLMDFVFIDRIGLCSTASGCWEHLCSSHWALLATFIIGDDLDHWEWSPGNGHWEWSFMTKLDIQSAQDDLLVTMDLVQVHQHYIATHTHITIALREQVIYVISHHILLKSLEAMVTWPVKKCSSDQTVTPLIREVSDWRLRRQIDYSGSRPITIKLVCDKWRLYPMDWLLLRIGFYFHIGCELWNWIPYILDMLFEIRFLMKRTLEKWP